MKGFVVLLGGWWVILVDGVEVNAFKTVLEVGRWLRARNGRLGDRSPNGHSFTTEYVLLEDLPIVDQVTVVI